MYNQAAFFSSIVEILWFRSEDSILMYLVSFSHFSTLQDTSVFQYTGEESSLIIGDNNDIRENVVISRATFAGNQHSDVPCFLFPF